MADHSRLTHGLPEDLPLDLDPMRRAADRAAEQAADNAILHKIGNNHRGTLYANAEPAVEPPLVIALADPGWPANAALDALTEMIDSFQPLLALNRIARSPTPA